VRSRPSREFGQENRRSSHGARRGSPAHWPAPGGPITVSLKDANVASPKRKRVAIVIANPSISTSTGRPCGFWWAELTPSYFVLTEKGYEVEIFSPDGGKCEADSLSDPRDESGYSASDLISLGFMNTPRLAGLVASTRPVKEMELGSFDAILA